MKSLSINNFHIRFEEHVILMPIGTVCLDSLILTQSFRDLPIDSLLDQLLNDQFNLLSNIIVVSYNEIRVKGLFIRFKSVGW